MGIYGRKPLFFNRRNGLVLSRFWSGVVIAGFLVVFLIADPTNDKEAYDKKGAGNQGEQDVHDSIKRV